MAEEIEKYHEIGALEQEWDRLAIRTQAAPFLRPGWISAWWDAFGSGALEIFAFRSEGRLAGVLPTVRQRGVIRSPTNWHTPAFGAMAEDAEATLALYAAVLREAPRRLDISFLRAEGADIEGMTRAAGRYRTLRRPLMSSPYVLVDRDWEAYWSALSKNLRGTVRRCRRRLADRGEVTVEIAGEPSDLAWALEEGFRLEASGWKGEAGTAIASRPETRSFYRQVSTWAAEAGILCLGFLRVDGEAVAFTLGLESNGRHYLLKPGHDAALGSFGPGTVLTAAMVERTFSLGLGAYEFLGGADDYKLRWAGACHDLLRVQAFAPGLGGSTDRVTQTHGRRAARWLLRKGRRSSRT